MAYSEKMISDNFQERVQFTTVLSDLSFLPERPSKSISGEMEVSGMWLDIPINATIRVELNTMTNEILREFVTVSGAIAFSDLGIMKKTAEKSIMATWKCQKIQTFLDHLLYFLSPSNSSCSAIFLSMCEREGLMVDHDAYKKTIFDREEKSNSWVLSYS
jgi:hypothetical protein